MAEQIARGSKIAVLITMSGLPTSMEFTDDDVDMEFHFYVNGRRSEKEIIIKKSELVKSESSTSIFWALLDTTELPLGSVMCEASVEYPYDVVGQDVLDKPVFDCGVTLIENT